MKISSKIYAKALVESLDENADPKKLAKLFWYTLQKKKQYKNLKEILEAIDREYAEKKGLVLVSVLSGKILSQNELHKIKTKLKEKFKKEVLIKNTVKEEITAGGIIKAESKEIDFTLDRKIEKLKERLKSK